MIFKIEFFRGAEKVMAIPCSKNREDAFKDAQAGLECFRADRAVIFDMDADGRAVGTIRR